MANWLTRVFRRDNAIVPMARPVRNDGWANVVTGLLSSRDKRMGGFNVIDLVTDIQGRDLWRGDDIAKRVIEVLPREAMRRGYQIKVMAGDDADKETSERIQS